MLDSIIPTINLPTPILIHALMLSSIGIMLTLFGKAPFGIATLAVGLSYLSTAYMPIAENQYLHASVPVRLLLGALSGVRALSAKKEDKTSLIGVAVIDLVGGSWLGWYLGSFGGKVAGF